MIALVGYEGGMCIQVAAIYNLPDIKVSAAKS